MQDYYLKSMLILKLSACATMHTTTLETQVLLIYRFISVIYVTCENRRTIMLENTEHYVNDNYIIYH